MLYDAFLSYSHAADGKLAPALQSGLQQFAKPWNRLRAVRVFRDKTGLSATPGLWSAIETALNGSKYFVLLASPRAAQSVWVEKEVEHWLTQRPTNSMLVVLTDGEIVWNNAAKDFDWEATTALPPAMRGKLTEEPLWVDMRWAKADDQLLLRNPKFRDVVADLSSALRDIPKDQLTGEDVRQHRKAVRLRRAALAGLTVLAAAVSVAAIVAVGQKSLAERNAALAKQNELTAVANAARATKNETLAKQNEQTAIANAERARKSEALAKQNLDLAQRNEARAQENQRHAEQNAAEARRQSERSLARQLAAQSEFLRGRREELSRATLIAVEAMRRYPSAETDQSLGSALAILPRQTRDLDIGGPVTDAVFDSKVKTLLARSGNEAQIWDLVAGSRRASIKSWDGFDFDGMALSRDGQKFALAIRCKINVYDVESGNQLAATEFINKPSGTESEFSNCYELKVMSFSPDGRLLAAGGWADVTKVWNMQTGEVRNLSHTRSARAQNVDSLEFSSDGKYLASERYQDVAVWSTNDWKRMNLESVPPASAGQKLVFSPGNKLIGAVAGYGAAVWELPDSKRHRGLMGLPGNNFTSKVAIALNGYRASDPINDRLEEGALIAASAGNEAVVWNLGGTIHEAGTQIARMTHQAPIVSLAFNHDARRLLTVSEDRTAAVWEIPGGKEVARLVSTGPVLTAVFSANNEVWTVDAAGVVRSWDLSASLGDGSADTRFLVRQGAGETWNVWDLREPGDWFARERKGNYLAVWSDLRHFLGAHYKWNESRALEGFEVEDLSEGKQVLLIKPAELDEALGESARPGIFGPSVSFSPDGRYVAIAGSAAWEIASSRRLDLASGVKLRGLVFSPDSRRAAGIEQDGTIRVTEIPSGRLLTRITAAKADPKARLVFSPNGRYLLRPAARDSGSWDMEPRVWDTSAQGGHAELLTQDGKPIDAEEFTADSNYVLKNDSAIEKVVAYNLTTKRTTEFKHDERSTYMATSPKELLVAIAWGDKVVLWDPRTGNEIARLDHFGVASVTFSPDGVYLATGGSDGLMRVWETATRRELARVTATGDVSFSSDGRYVGGVAWRPEDRIKDACERLTRNLTEDEWKLHLEGQPYRKTCSQLK